MAIADIGETLIGLLRDNIQNLPWQSIVLASPGEIEAKDDVRLSLFLYQILENVHLKNQDMQIKNSTTLGFPPVVLDLYYMLTSHISSSEHDLTEKTKEEHTILGRAIQVLNENSTLIGSTLKGSLAGSTDEIHIMLTSMNLDDVTKIWTTFQGKPFRTSVCFLVTPVLIDSTREVGVKRVVSKEMNYYRMVPNRG